jgi:mRNA interferase MazF
MAVVCPLTSRAKGYPFEVRLPAGHRLKGVILADQMKSIDGRERGGVRKVGKLPRFVVDEVLNRIAVLLQIS